MFATPICGWSKVVINDFEAPASYITDLPVDLIDAAITAIKDEKDLYFSFCGEDSGDFKVIADEYCTYIITDADDADLYVTNVTKKQIIDEIYHDVVQNCSIWMEEWYDKYDRYSVKRLQNKINEFIAIYEEE